MIPSKFEYVRPRSLDEAFAALAEHGDDAKILAGGHSLIPMMKLRLAEPGVLVDISRLPDLAGIAFDGSRFTIGATTKHAALAVSDDLRTHAPVLWEAANAVGDPQVRNRGTFGGALANGDPACDYAAVAFELGHTETTTPVNPLGIKGVGEAGTIGSTPCVVNAVMDALAPFGVKNIDMPLRPEKLYNAMHANGNGKAHV